MPGHRATVYRQVSHDVCLWNRAFASELREPAFAPRAVLAGRDARTLAREILAMTQPEFSAAFKGSAMKRAKLRGLKRNAAVVVGNVESADDVSALTRRCRTTSRWCGRTPLERYVV